jgi:hypothetical protein
MSGTEPFYFRMRDDPRADTVYLNGEGRLSYTNLVKMYVPMGAHGQAVYMYARFRDGEEWRQYEKSFMNIKRYIARCNKDHAERAIADDVLEMKMQKVWIPMVEEFITKYSAEMVPLDIRWAYNDVMKELGREERVWPTLIRLVPDRASI